MSSSSFQISSLSLSTDEEVCLYATQLMNISILPRTLKVAIELDLLEIIAKAGPDMYLSPADISSQLPTKNPQAPAMIDRMLWLLACYKVVSCSVETGQDGKAERSYGAAPVLKYFTKNEDGASMAPLTLLNLDKVNGECWYHFKDAVLEGGIPFNNAHGMSVFEYTRTDQRYNKVLNEAMRNHSTIVMKNILERYEGFDDIKVLVDVGGGLGMTMSMILKKHPHIKGINFDLPHVISEAPAIPGVEHIGGDMFERVPSGDVIFMKWILHDWSDERCLKLLRNCWKALPENGKVIVFESLMQVYPEATSAVQSLAHLDLTMLAINLGGKERTKAEYESLAKGSGFSRSKSLCGFANFWILEFHK